MGADLQELLYLLVFTVLSFAFAVASVIAGFVCGYKNESDEKSQIYECGMKLFSDAKIQFDLKYFNFAVIFLMYDVVTFLLFPFAVSFNSINIFILFEIFLFLGILLVSMFYIVRKDVFGVGK